MLAIDRISKFTYVAFHDSAGKMEGSAFLNVVVEVLPYKIHTVQTDNSMAFADLSKNRQSLAAASLVRTSIASVWQTP